MDQIFIELAKQVPYLVAFIVFAILLTRDHNKTFQEMQKTFEDRLTIRDENFLNTLNKFGDQLQCLEAKLIEHTAISSTIMEWIIRTDEEAAEAKKRKK